MYGRLPSLIAACLLILAAPACAGDGPSRSGGRITLVPDDEGESFVIPKAEFDRTIARGPSWFIHRVAVRPVMLDGRFTGFQLLSLFPDQPELATRAIRAGDIIQRVNDQPIGRPEEFMAVWESLAGADHLAIQFVRDGRVLRVTWLIQPEVAATAGAAP
ncbi:MAG: hypothetical protein H6744_04930 [Deltaproteobacteria bacterium]|nr:hypothetical protein [Deltaproteobacteria bacterium]MCB9786021.1 hypothetical protein [Deltaproteobacteria bacterium]